MSSNAGLTGKQVRAFREHLHEGQIAFGKRIASSQAAVSRLESKGDDVVLSSETMLLRRIAADLGYSFGEQA